MWGLIFNFFILFGTNKDPPFERLSVWCASASWLFWVGLWHFCRTLSTFKCSLRDLLLEVFKRIINKVWIKIGTSDILCTSLTWPHKFLHQKVIGACLFILLIFFKTLDNFLSVKTKSRCFIHDLFIMMYHLFSIQTITWLIFGNLPPLMLLDLL